MARRARGGTDVDPSWSAVRIAAAVAALALAITLVVTSAGSPSARSAAATTCSAAHPVCVYVDAASRGGRCDDGRSVAQAESARTPWCTLQRAVSAVRGGALVLIRGGSYPALRVLGRRYGPRVVFAAYRHERVALTGGFDIESSSGVAVRGLHMTSTTEHSDVFGSQRIDIDHNDFAGQGMLVRADRELRIAGNTIHDLSRGAASDPFAGYGIWANGVLTRGPGDGLAQLTIVGNVFRNIPQDGIQVGGGHDLVAGVLIAGNDFGPVRRVVGTDHPDPIQIIGGRGVTIRDNVFHDSEDAIIVKDDVTTGLVVSGNLMVGWPGGCIQAQFWNTPGARVTNNTIWRSTCIGLRFAADPSVGPPPTGLVVLRNVVDVYSLPDPRWVARQDDNVILRGPRLGPHDTARRPVFTRALRVTGWARRRGIGASVGLG